MYRVDANAGSGFFTIAAKEPLLYGQNAAIPEQHYENYISTRPASRKVFKEKIPKGSIIYVSVNSALLASSAVFRILV
jgi:hypothetical protein